MRNWSVSYESIIKSQIYGVDIYLENNYIYAAGREKKSIAICSFTGTIIRRGHLEWVTSELNKMNIKINKTFNFTCYAHQYK